ncbi:MAG: DUF3105 domain-containing protein [Patescibacteria group bacterium]|nr:DUF3105 domain-containing protein [Patescibacteria group bacterium]
MTTESKVYIGGAVATGLILIGAVVLFSKGDERLNRPLLGQKVQVSAMHVSLGTNVSYNSNPPAGGEHYGDSTGHSGFYDTTNVPADGYLVHSLEHGGVILWYNPKQLSQSQIDKLKDIFNQTTGKGIVAPRSSMDVPIALSSWGQVLKLKTIDEKQIKAFFDTNEGRGPEQAPI